MARPSSRRPSSDYRLAACSRELDDPRSWHALALLQQRLLRERWADHEVPGLEGLVEFLRQQSRQSGFRGWTAVSDRDEVIGSASLSPDSQGVAGAAQTSIFVTPERRREGIGFALLAEMMRHARRCGIDRLSGRTDSLSPAGESFARRCGARPGVRVCVQELDTTDVKADRLIAPGGEASGESEIALARIEGRYPDDRLDAIARLKLLVAGSYRVDLPDVARVGRLLRDAEAMLHALAFERWTLCASSRRTNELVGYTEALWDPNLPTVVEQGGTCVAEAARGVGLARRLKAVMLTMIVRERPQVRRIVTVNPADGEAILKLNDELGFRLHHEQQVWTVKVADLTWMG